MSKNNGFFGHVGTGFKAIVGSLMHSIVIGSLIFIATLFTGGLENFNFGIVMLLFFVSLIISIFLLGWIYNLFWGWE